MLKRLLPQRLPFAPTRSLSTSVPRLLASTPSLSLPPKKIGTPAKPAKKVAVAKGSVGSGKGGRKEKDEAAAKAKLRLKAKAEKEKLKLKAVKEKEKLKKKKETAKKAAVRAKPKKKVTVPKKPSTRSLLHPPKAPGNAWTVFFSDWIINHKASVPAGTKLASVPTLTREAAPQYHALGADERAQLLSRVQEAREAYPATLKAWKDSLTPEMIKEENLVRFRRRKLGLSSARKLRLDGEPKMPLTGFMRFGVEARRTPQDPPINGVKNIIEQSKVIAAAWRALAPEEQKVYKDAGAEEKAAWVVAKKEFDEAQEAKSAVSKEVEA